MAATVILNGRGAAFGALDYAPGGGPGTFTSIEAQLTDIATTGVLELQNGRDFSTANALTDDGQVLLAGGTLSAAAGLTLSATGMVSGAGVVSGAFTDDGVVAAARGTLVLNGAASGQGALSIGAGATLKLATDTSVGVTFAGAGGTLALATNTLTAAVTGYAGGETIDLRHAIVSAAGSSGDSLTLTTESGQVVISLGAPLAPGTGFMLTPDGLGGTDVTSVAPSAKIVSDSGTRFIVGDGGAVADVGATLGASWVLDGHDLDGGIIAGGEREIATTITDWTAASARDVAKLPRGDGVFHGGAVIGDGGFHSGLITLHPAGGGFSILQDKLYEFRQGR